QPLRDVRRLRHHHRERGGALRAEPHGGDGGLAVGLVLIAAMSASALVSSPASLSHENRVAVAAPGKARRRVISGHMARTRDAVGGRYSRTICDVTCGTGH